MKKISFKLKGAIDIVFYISILLALITVFWGASTSMNNQITSKSLNDLRQLNNEILKLSELAGKKYIDKEKLKFDVRNLIEPKYFEKYSYLENFVYSDKSMEVYTPNISNLQKKGGLGKDLRKLTQQIYFEKDTLQKDIRNLSGMDKYMIENDDFNSELKLVHLIYPLKDLTIPDSIIKQLERIKNISYKSDDAFEQGIKVALGIKNYGYYSNIIKGSSDWLSHRVKVLSKFIIIIFLIALMGKIFIERFIKVKSEKLEEKGYFDKIKEAQEKISENPNDIQPMWDIAYNTLQQYYSRNLKQINSIYSLSIIVMILGFILIVSIIITSFFIIGVLQLKQLGIIAGIITEFIGATFLLIYKSTIQQAIRHSKSLEEINKVGMSIKIINSIEVTDANKERIETAKIDISQKLLSNS